MKTNLVEQSYNLISNMVFQYQLPPGSKVSDYSLSKELGISRTPIRTAITMLVSEDLLEAEGIRFKVPEFTVERINHIYDARICIQTSALHLAMTKGIQKNDIRDLRNEISNINNYNAKGNIFDSITHDVEFNHKLALLCKNPFLIKDYLRLEKQTRVLSFIGITAPSFAAPVFYTTICDCIEDNDFEGARKALQGFLESSRNQKVSILQDFDSEFLKDVFSYISMNYTRRTQQKSSLDCKPEKEEG